MSPALEWLRAHALAAWPALSLVLILVLRTRTPEAWVALGERQPRLQGLIRALRAAGLDPVKLVAGLAQLVTGRAPVDPREAELSQLRTELAALQRRVTESHAVTAPGVAHPAQMFAPRFEEPSDGQRGSVSLRALLAVVVGLSVVLPVGVALSGCPPVNRDPTIAPPPAPADAGTTTCHNGAPWRFTAGEWSQADRQCNRLSTDASAVVCCATPSALRPDASVHACVPMALCSPEVSR